MKPRVGLLAGVLIAAGVGCVPMTGVPSVSLMTRELPPSSDDLEWVGEPIEESETWTWALVALMWGTPPTHESVVDRALDKHDADVLLDADLETSQFGLPYIFMQRKCTVRGQPARYRNRGGK